MIRQTADGGQPGDPGQRHVAYSRGTPMTSALSPHRRSTTCATLIADIGRPSCSTATARCLAGAAALAEPARALLAAAPDADELEVATTRGTGLRRPLGAPRVVVVSGRFALPALMLYDLRMLLAELDAGR